MTIQATERKIKKSFTLAPEAVAFVSQTREKRKAGSDSEALEMLLRELILEAKRQAIEAAITEYYDTASDEELAEEEQWAEMAGPGFLADIDSSEAQL
jgi:hemerythrin superfamily protein